MLHPLLGQLLNRDQRIGHFSITVEGGFLIHRECLVESRLCDLAVPAQTTPLIDRL